MPPQPREKQLSVVMPVHNALPHLDKAVESIVRQTWSDFEFVIYDDGSTDGSAERLRHWAARDERIRLVEGGQNLGPAASSNFVVQLARGSLVARMDADDISRPDRLQRQIELLKQRPEVGLVGTAYETIDARGTVIRGPNLWRLHRPSWFVPFPHGSILFRRELFDRIGGYREQCVFWEDQDFFLRASAVTKIVTLAAPLYQHRHSEVSTRLASDQERVETAVDLMYRSVRRLKDNSDYEALLASPLSPKRTRVDPHVFVSLGSLVLWSGGRPNMLRRLLSRGKLSPNLHSATALVWTSWAALAPSALRAFLRLIAATRNLMARRREPTDAAVEWRTPRKLRQLAAAAQPSPAEKSRRAPARPAGAAQSG